MWAPGGQSRRSQDRTRRRLEPGRDRRLAGWNSPWFAIRDLGGPMDLSAKALRQQGFGPDGQRSCALHDRAGAARAMLRSCAVCELRCGVDRTRNEPCPCHLGADTYQYKRYISLNEESSLAPALRVFLGGCNFRCRFCDEGSDCFRRDHGEVISPDLFAEGLEAALDAGAKTVSLIGGEPTLHPHTILATAASATKALPLVLNSNMYMTPEVLNLLDGVVTLYLADFKFGNDGCAKHLAGVPRYMEVVCRNLKHATQLTNVVVRHLLIPGHLDCCFRPVVDWMAENLPTTRFQLYTGYVPCWRASGDRTIGRLNSRGEAQQAIEILNSSGVADSVVMDEHRWEKPPKNLRSSADVSITIGADGRIYCHDLTPELAALVGDICSRTDESTTGSRLRAADVESDR